MLRLARNLIFGALVAAALITPADAMFFGFFGNAFFPPVTNTYTSTTVVTIPVGATQLVYNASGMGGSGGTGTSGAHAAAGGGSGAKGTKTIAIDPADWGTTVTITIDSTSTRITFALTHFSGTLTVGAGQTGNTGTGAGITGGAAGTATGSWDSSTNGSQGGSTPGSTTGGTGANGPSGTSGGAGGLAAGNVAGGTGASPEAGGGGGPYDVTDALNGIPGSGGGGQGKFAWT